MKIRASAAAALMCGVRGLTTKQNERLEYLNNRKSDPSEKPLTDKMEKERKALAEKKAAPFELSATAKTLVEDTWLQNEYDAREHQESKHTLKGQMCEQDAIELVDQLHPIQGFRMKNTDRFKKGYFEGTPDVVLKDLGRVEDLKTSWDLRTFYRVKSLDKAYFWQGQVYMYLTGTKTFRVYYCLVDTPDALIQREELSFFYKYGQDYDNPEYLEAIEQVRRLHEVEHIPAEKRCKMFEFSYWPEGVRELKERCKAALKYYKTISLDQIDPVIFADYMP